MLTVERIQKIVKVKLDSAWFLYKTYVKTFGSNAESTLLAREAWSVLYTLNEMLNNEEFFSKIEEIYLDEEK